MVVAKLNRDPKYKEVDISPKLDSSSVCLTLDLEQDYGDLLDKPTYDGISYIPEVISFAKERNIPLTVFVQGSLLAKFPSAIEQLTKLDVEFELHSYSHLRYNNTNTKYQVEYGKKAFSSFFGKDPEGYRFPSGVLNKEDYSILAANGFRFDSSVFPSVRPGTFNNVNMPIKPYYLEDDKIVELPFTVLSRYVRIPISLSYIKLLGWPYLELIKSSTLPGLIIFNFHMHDLFTLPGASSFKRRKFSLLDRFIFKRTYQQKNNNGFILLERMMSIFQERRYNFVKMKSIYDLVIKEINENNLWQTSNNPKK